MHRNDYRYSIPAGFSLQNLFFRFGPDPHESALENQCFGSGSTAWNASGMHWIRAQMQKKVRNTVQKRVFRIHWIFRAVFILAAEDMSTER